MKSLSTNRSINSSNNSNVEGRLLRLEKALASYERRINSLEASARVTRKVCDLLAVDLAYDDRALSAIKRVQQMMQRTFPEQCNSGIVWLSNNSCNLASLPPDCLISILGYLKCKFGRTALNKVAPVFWMPQPNLKSAVSLSSFVFGHGEAVITLSGHKGTYAKFMGMYELDIRHIVHGYPLFKKIGMNNPHFIYKCSLNGKWLVTDDESHCPKNLSRIGSKYGSESPDEPGMIFEIWQEGAWVIDPNLQIIEGKFTNIPQVITFSGHSGPQVRFMGTYELDYSRIIHGYPIYKRKHCTKLSDKNCSLKSDVLTGQQESCSSLSSSLESDENSNNSGSLNTSVGSYRSQSGESERKGVDSRRKGLERGSKRRDFVYKCPSPPTLSFYSHAKRSRRCSLNGKWLITDDDEHFPMNLSRVGTDSSVEFVTDPGVRFEVWRNGTWHKDPNLKVTVDVR